MSEEYVDDILASIPADGKSQDLMDLEASANTEVSGVPEVKATPTSADLQAELDNTSKGEAKSVEVKPDKDAEAVKENDTLVADQPSEASIETLAKQLGWSPDHKGEEYVDAATYILRSRDIQTAMRDHNRELKSQLTTMKSSIDALQSHNERVYKAEVARLEKELVDLTKKKDEAIEVGDVEGVRSLDQQIDSVKENIKVPAPVQKTTTNPVYDAWVADNQWYVTDPEMAAYADQVAQQYVGAPADRIYKAVRGRVAELWPEKFASTQPTGTPTPNGLQSAGQSKPVATKPIMAPNPVEGGHKQVTPNTFTKADLTPSQQSMMSQFSKLGIMTEEQYIADIAKLQGA